LLASVGDEEGTETQLAAADRLSPRDPQIWAARGEIYATWGATRPAWYAEAEKALRHAVSLSPNVATYHTALGMVLAQQGRLDQGARELERAVALDATDAVAYDHLIDLYRALGRDAEADRVREEAERHRD
jgi:Flp pilus assembly protein TadD